MKLKILAVAFMVGGLWLSLTAPMYAQMGMMGIETDDQTATPVPETHAETVEAVLQQILQNHHVSTVPELDLTTISDSEWETLGDAVMELQHPGEAHEAMDRMMGGEGSESLRQMHISMGKAYLGYAQGNYGSGMMGNYRFNQTPNPYFNRMPMMNWGYSWNSSYGIMGLITWLMVIAFLGSGTYLFLSKARKK